MFVSKDLLKIASNYVDEFIVDIKILNPSKCNEVLGGDINQYLRNLTLLDMNKTTFRILLSDFTLDDQNINLILELLDKFKPKKLEIFKIHNLAQKKYLILKKEQYFNEVSDEDIKIIYSKLNSICNCSIIEI